MSPCRLTPWPPLGTERTTVNFLFGNCVFCGKYLDSDAYNRQEVFALIGADGTIVCCVKHIVKRGTPEYKSALEKIALAKVAQLQGKN
jgi:hypothetical protein